MASQVHGLNPRERRTIERDAADNVAPVHDSTDIQADASTPRHAGESVCVHYGGRQFVSTYEMAGIFLRRSQRLIDTEDAELVPLVHEGGLELLYVSCATPFSVHDLDTEPSDGSHPSLPAAGACTTEES